MKKFDRTQKAYDFFKRNEGNKFNSEQLALLTGWTVSTVDTYVSKKWFHFLEKSDKEFIIKKFNFDTFEDFCKLQTQNYAVARADEYDYDVAMSFAGEDRIFVEQIADFLKEFNINIFYDKYFESDLWGKNLYTHLDDVYQNKSQFCVLFISQHYKQKLWTNHERESAQARAFRERVEYILPVKMDDTTIPGLRDTIGYIDGRKNTPEQIGRLILRKLNRESELDGMISLLQEHLEDYKLSINGAYLKFECENEEYEGEYPIGMLLEMYKHNLLVDLMIIAAIVPN